MAIGIDPLNDYAFQMLFGHADHKMLTISLINTLLDGEPPVTDVAFPITIHNKLSADGKLVMLDVLAEDGLGRKLNIKVQIGLSAGALIEQPAQLHRDFRFREKSLPLTLTDQLQIHVLQLNHLQVTADTLCTASPVERWCWFLRHAQELTTEQLTLLLPEKEFTEAAKVLDRIAQTPEQLQEYNARLKA